MLKHVQAIVVVCVSAFLALGLAACSNANAASSGSQSASQAASSSDAQTVTREDVEPVLHKAAEQTFSNVSFSVRTETSATGATSNGTPQTQTMTSAMTGELDKAGDKPKMHMRYEAQSNTQLGKTVYDMYINSENLIVNQNDQLFVDAMNDETLKSYADSVSSIITTKEIDAVLDTAASFKMEEKDGETTVSVTVDKDKLLESGQVDESSLPEGTSIATMVVSYVIGADGHYKTVRIMSSTSGTPTYRVHQTYQYSKYSETALPEWPDLQAYVAKQSGIQTDANGRMYITGDDGQVYYITEIGDDGMIYYDTGNTGGSTTETITYETGPAPTADTGNTSAPASDSASAANPNDQGRAYITADDGTIHFLDEEGSRLIENSDGTRYFIDADGNFYYLAEE